MAATPSEATRTKAAIAAAAMIRAAAQAQREQAIIDREVAITQRDLQWRVVAHAYPRPSW